MAVLKIVPNIATDNVQVLCDFYKQVFDLELLMDMSWIATLGASNTASTQISFASEGGSGTPVPHLSIEVDNIDEIYKRAQKCGCEITYEMVTEPWGVQRFYIKDPAGHTINVLQHC